MTTYELDELQTYLKQDETIRNTEDDSIQIKLWGIDGTVNIEYILSYLYHSSP